MKRERKNVKNVRARILASGMRRAVIAAVLGATGLGLGALGCDAANAMVGDVCAPGFALCGGRCIDPSADALNCGVCGNACGSGICAAGACSTAGAGTSARGHEASEQASGASTRDDAGVGPSTRDAAARDASPDSGEGYSPGDHANEDAPDASEGGASAVDASVAIDDAIDAAADSAAVVCVVPRIMCSGECVALAADPANCGACGNVCPSGRCGDGACLGRVPGNVVAIGQDYAVATTRSQDMLLANAALLRPSSRVRVLYYDHDAAPAAAAHVTAVLARAAQESGHPIVLTRASADDVDAVAVSTADVLLVLDQSDAPAGQLVALGARWAGPLGVFTKDGGVVIVLDGASGTGEMPAFVSGTGLLPLQAHAPVDPGTPLDVVGAGDAVGVAVVSPYSASTHSARFAIDPVSDLAVVVRDPASLAPVVVHRVIF